MGYFIKRAYDKNTGKEVNYPDKVKDAAGNEFFFICVEKLDEVCVADTIKPERDNEYHNGKPEEYGLTVKEVEMPNGNDFAVYTYTMLVDDDVHQIEPYNVKFHGFVEIFTKKKVNKDVEGSIEAAAKDYANSKEKAVRQELLDILRRQRSSGCYLGDRPKGVISGCCAIKVVSMPHTNYNFDWTVGDKPLIECIKNNYNLFREQISRGNYRTAYPINLDEEGDEE